MDKYTMSGIVSECVDHYTKFADCLVDKLIENPDIYNNKQTIIEYTDNITHISLFKNILISIIKQYFECDINIDVIDKNYFMMTITIHKQQLLATRSDGQLQPIESTNTMTTTLSCGHLPYTYDYVPIGTPAGTAYIPRHIYELETR